MRTRRWLCLLAVMPVGLHAQIIVPVHEEPRHNLVHDGGWLRVLDVRIEPGDTTLFHVHASPIHYVSIDASPTKAQVLGNAWPPGNTPTGAAAALTVPGRGFWSLEYAEQPLTHRVTNTGTGLFRLIAVTNEGRGINEAEQAGRLVADTLPGTLEAESRWFRRARLTLPPGADARLRSSAGPVLVVQVSPGRATGAGFSARGASATAAAGDWMLVETAEPVRLSNTGEGDVVLLLVQVLR